MTNILHRHRWSLPPYYEHTVICRCGAWWDKLCRVRGTK